MRPERESVRVEDEQLDALHTAWIRIRDEADDVCRFIEKRAGVTRLQMQRRIRDKSQRRILIERYGKRWQEKIGRAEWEVRGRPMGDD